MNVGRMPEFPFSLLWKKGLKYLMGSFSNQPALLNLAPGLNYKSSQGVSTAPCFNEYLVERTCNTKRTLISKPNIKHLPIQKSKAVWQHFKGMRFKTSTAYYKYFKKKIG